MTNNLKSGLLFASAVAVALTASPASAKMKKPGWVKKSVGAVTDTVTTVANNVPNKETDNVAKAVGYANFAAAQAKGYADSEILEVAYAEAKANDWKDLAAADAASVAIGFKNYAQRMEEDSRAIVEYNGLLKKAGENYGPEFRAAANKYEAARKVLDPVILKTNSVANYVANTCKASATGSWGKITPFVNKATKFNPATQDAVFRLLRTLARGSNPDQQTATDMLDVGTALGMVSANGFALVGNVVKSNFSISLGGGGGWIGGVNASVSFAMDTFTTNLGPVKGKHGMAVTVSSGIHVAAGTADLQPGASFGFALGWGPGSAADAEGQTLTAGGDAGGVDVAAQWTLPPSLVQVLATDAAKNDLNADSLKNALTTTVTDSIKTVCQAPGISAGVSIPSSANMGNVTFSPGYTTVVWRGLL